jgi:hypothetical protein
MLFRGEHEIRKGWFLGIRLGTASVSHDQALFRRVLVEVLSIVMLIAVRLS